MSEKTSSATSPLVVRCHTYPSATFSSMYCCGTQMGDSFVAAGGVADDDAVEQIWVCNPSNNTTTGHLLNNARFNSSMIFMSNMIIFYGGAFGLQRYSTERFVRMVDDVFEDVTEQVRISGDESPPPLTLCSFTVVCDGQEGTGIGAKAILFGGSDVNGRTNKMYELECIDEMEFKWSLVKHHNKEDETFPTIRESHGMCRWKENTLILFMGLNRVSYLRDIFEFNVVSREFSLIRQSGKAPKRGRQRQMGGIIGDFLIVFGGAYINALNAIHVFNLETRTWMEFEVDYETIPRRMGAACAVIGNQLMISNGQGDREEPQSDVFGLELSLIEWTKELHRFFPDDFKECVFEMLLMHHHDQYEQGECNGFEWNMLPWEVIQRIIVKLGNIYFL
eukprot:TRINITY_DN862_c1_g5_i1.p1 TRINITY_DN862_c1_g5~~TRINITY_DN862_c1_g5_i1.p1  ORF type:complete len:404 (+),score=95.05 TRINITY_DN862_c1_g5_i1:39-1214(+)